MILKFASYEFFNGQNLFSNILDKQIWCYEIERKTRKRQKLRKVVGHILRKKL